MFAKSIGKIVMNKKPFFLSVYSHNRWITWMINKNLFVNLWQFNRNQNSCFIYFSMNRKIDFIAYKRGRILTLIKTYKFVISPCYGVWWKIIVKLSHR